MRVALLPSSYHPAIGGVEELSRHLAASLVATGHVVEIWAPAASGGAIEDCVDGVPVRRTVLDLPPASLPHLLQFPIAGTRALRRLQAAVRAFRPDVLHVQCFGPNGAYATALSLLTGTPLVITLQGETMMDDHDIYEHSTQLRLALRAGLHHARVITGCSQVTLADAEARFGLRPGRGLVIPNGVDLMMSPTRRVELPFERYVLGVGRVVEKKGFDLLLSAFARIAPDHRGLGLVIAGRGDARPDLEHQASAAGLAARVHFPGPLAPDQVADVMARAEVFVMPSRFEPFGIVVLEAWRAGTPVVATSKGGPAEFVHHGEDGLLADPFDTNQLAGVLASLLADPARRSQLAEAGRIRVAEYSWQAITERYVACYDEAVSHVGGSRPPGREPPAEQVLRRTDQAAVREVRDGC